MLDAATLLQPISPDKPSGIDLRLAQLTDHPLDKIRQERRQEDPLTLPPGTEPRKIAWPNVLDGCRVLLVRHSKDLEAAAYLCEALVRQHGLEGLDRGLEVTAGLLGTFWPTLHPGAPSSEDPEPNPALRAKWLVWLGSSADLQQALATVPLGFAGRDGRMLTFGDLLDARRVQRAYQANPTEYARLVEAQLTTPDAWTAAVAGAPIDARDKVAAAAGGCLERLQQLEAAAASVFPEGEAPGLGKLGELLELLRTEMQQGGGMQAGEAGAEATADAGSGAPGGGAARAPAVPGSIQSRDDAARAVQGVIKFLRATEPHSPVSYMLERCVRWLGMGFDDLMLDLVKDQGVVDALREKLGIQAPQQQQQ
ncbi:MAG: type VI secretion system protein TssA [Planctomycetes bacterium]|nr:type VI secretion system protein TssA [Planctomycetota bacterium]